MSGSIRNSEDTLQDILSAADSMTKDLLNSTKSKIEPSRSKGKKKGKGKKNKKNKAETKLKSASSQSTTVPQSDTGHATSLDSLMTGIEEYLNSPAEGNARTTPQISSELPVAAESERSQMPVSKEPKISSGKVVGIVSHTIGEFELDKDITTEPPTDTPQKPEVIQSSNNGSWEAEHEGYLKDVTATTDDKPISIAVEEKESEGAKLSEQVAEANSSIGNLKKSCDSKSTDVTPKNILTVTPGNVVKDAKIPSKVTPKKSELSKTSKETLVEEEIVTNNILGINSTMIQADMGSAVQSNAEPSKIELTAGKDTPDKFPKGVLTGVSLNKQIPKTLRDHEIKGHLQREAENIPLGENLKEGEDDSTVMKSSAAIEVTKRQTDMEVASSASLNGSPRSSNLTAAESTSVEQTLESTKTETPFQGRTKSEKERIKRRSRPLSVSDLLEPESLTPLEDITAKETLAHTPQKLHETPRTQAESIEVEPTISDVPNTPSSLPNLSVDTTSTPGISSPQSKEAQMEDKEVSTESTSLGLENDHSMVQKETKGEQQPVLIETLDKEKSNVFGGKEVGKKDNYKDKEDKGGLSTKTESVTKSIETGGKKEHQKQELFEGSITLSKEPKIPLENEKELSISPLKLNDAVFPTSLETTLSKGSLPELVLPESAKETSDNLVLPATGNEETLEEPLASATKEDELSDHVEITGSQDVGNEPDALTEPVAKELDQDLGVVAAVEGPIGDVEPVNPESLSPEAPSLVTKDGKEEVERPGIEAVSVPEVDSINESSVKHERSTAVQASATAEEHMKEELDTEPTLAAIEPSESHEEAPTEEDEELGDQVTVSPVDTIGAIVEHEKQGIVDENDKKSKAEEKETENISEKPFDSTIQPSSNTTKEISTPTEGVEESNSKTIEVDIPITAKSGEKISETKAEPLQVGEDTSVTADEGESRVGSIPTQKAQALGEKKKDQQQEEGVNDEFDEEIELSREFEKLRIAESPEEEETANDELITSKNVLDGLNLENEISDELTEAETTRGAEDSELEHKHETTLEEVAVADDISPCEKQESEKAKPTNESETGITELKLDNEPELEAEPEPEPEPKSDKVAAISTGEPDTKKDDGTKQEQQQPGDGKETEEGEKAESQETKEVLSDETGDASTSKAADVIVSKTESEADKGINDILAETDAFLKELEFVDDSELNALLESMESGAKKSKEQVQKSTSGNTATGTMTTPSTKEIKKSDIVEANMKEPVYIYTSLAGGGFHMIPRTNRLATILQANKIEFTYRDLGTDDEARKVWKTYGKGRSLPAVVRGRDDIIGNWEEVDELNEEYRVREAIYETI